MPRRTVTTACSRLAGVGAAWLNSEVSRRVSGPSGTMPGLVTSPCTETSRLCRPEIATVTSELNTTRRSRRSSALRASAGVSPATGTLPT